MEIGLIGLGKMGGNIARRLLRNGHQVVGYNRDVAATEELVKDDGMTPAYSAQELGSKLTASTKVVWMLVPSGPVVDETIDLVLPSLKSGDIIVDGGNSNFKDSMARAARLKAKGIHFVDCGTSGGVWGLEKGYCLMLGGEKAAIQHIEPALKTLAPPEGYLHAGPSGAGHYVKMIHNGMEYALMQSYAEGFDIMANSQFPLDLGAISHLWNQGSVVRSWLLELAENMFEHDPKLEKLKGWVDDSGMGRWTVQESIDLSIPAPTITASLQARFRSRRENQFSDRFLAALRNQFGGHAVHSKK